MSPTQDAVVEWLLDSDPSIRWQVMRDLTDAPPAVVDAERSRVALEGWGAQLLDRQNRLFEDPSLKLSEQWDRACDYLDEDIASGYVRVLQELIAVSWHDAEVAKVIRAGLMGWIDLIVGLARKTEQTIGPLGPFSAEEVGAIAASSFIGGESLFLLGLEKKGSPIRASLRRVGDLIRIAEGSSPDKR